MPNNNETIINIAWVTGITLCVIAITAGITIANIYAPCNVPSI